ncbi:hypothetical protein JCM10908_002800 [Rhodotorula pacifica]|uniref:PQ-loop repeat-containing protein n=1 Tax=Rhodotorula pacifica TaxID=1495444 RepID=UPI00317D0C0A
MSLYVAEQVCGWIGTILWCIQLIPQVWMNYRRKTTAGLSGAMCATWALSGVTLGVYAIGENINIPIIVQPHCYGSLCAVMLCQKLYYDKGRSWKTAVAAFLAYAVAAAGFEVAMVFASRHVEHNGSNGLTMTWGILSSVFLTVGFIPQLYEIYLAKEVAGLSYLFLFLDSSGAVFSILSLAFKSKLDIIALVGYIAVLVLEILIVVLALVLNPRARRARARESIGGMKTCPSTQTTLACDDETPTGKCGDLEEQAVEVSLPREEERRRRSTDEETVFLQEGEQSKLPTLPI